MEKEKQLKSIREYVKNIFQDDATGHDYFHMKRVAKVAKLIAEKENADSFVTEAAGLLHDVGDHKLFNNPSAVLDEMYLFLKSIHVQDDDIEKIKIAMKDVSFSKGNVPVTLEGKIVQDADRIDAIGAIGIARTFAFGGAKGQLIYHDAHNESTSIQHFHDKLLKLKELIHTTTAKKMANERHAFMEAFLKEFHREW
ncbi:HD domain-containing protein [Virgibacillus oceani]|uniref:Phosphohydrolase n=1 Tax=Virgibacillus oceani TaxID=1479511 RepID=A0A917H3B6_9BACI|nr:HD domain-containing protein [Virgibacillus oceani]GGG65657.1 phosphohydrolase [Virgibacillus oceani]